MKDVNAIYLETSVSIFLNNTANNYSNDFLNVLLNFGFYSRIDRLTRITETTATLTITNVHETNNMSSGIWLADITDHLRPITIVF